MASIQVRDPVKLSSETGGKSMPVDDSMVVDDQVALSGSAQSKRPTQLMKMRGLIGDPSRAA